MSSAEQIAKQAKDSFDASQLLDAQERHRALVALKDALTAAKADILQANKQDIEVRHPCIPSVCQRGWPVAAPTRTLPRFPLD